MTKVMPGLIGVIWRMLLAEGIQQQLAILKLHVSKTNINWWWYDDMMNHDDTIATIATIATVLLCFLSAVQLVLSPRLKASFLL